MQLHAVTFYARTLVCILGIHISWVLCILCTLYEYSTTAQPPVHKACVHFMHLRIQNRLILLDSIFNKFKYGFGCGIFCIKYDLVFQVQPLKCKIDNTPSFPMILHLLACTIDNVRNFIGYYKLLILCKLK